MIEGEAYLWLDDAFTLWAAAVGLDLAELRRTPVANSDGDAQLSSMWPNNEELRRSYASAAAADDNEDLRRWWSALGAVAGRGEQERKEMTRMLDPRWHVPAPVFCPPELEWHVPELEWPQASFSGWEQFVSGEGQPGLGILGLWERWRVPRNDMIVSKAGAERLAARFSAKKLAGEGNTPSPAPGVAGQAPSPWEWTAATVLNNLRDEHRVPRRSKGYARALWVVIRKSEGYSGPSNPFRGDERRLYVRDGPGDGISFPTWERFATHYRKGVFVAE